MKIAVVIMASGFGKRYGANKLLEEYRGRPLYEYPLRLAEGSSASQVILVSAYKAIRAAAKEKYPGVTVLPNAHPENGISESLKIGLAAAGDADGCCFMVSDQPGLTLESLEKMFARFRADPESIYAFTDGKRRGNPVLFPRSLFPELLALRGDRGGRQVIKRYPERVRLVEVASAAELADVDTPEELVMLTRAGRSSLP